MYGILRQVVWLRNLVLIMERVIIPLNKMGVGLPFNILQLIGLFSYYLSVKKNDDRYNLVGWIYIFSILYGIVDYHNVITIILFFIQIFIVIAFPPKKNKSNKS